MTTPPLKPVRASNVQQVLRRSATCTCASGSSSGPASRCALASAPQLSSLEPPAHQNVLAARLAGVESERAVERQGGRFSELTSSSTRRQPRASALEHGR